MNFLLLSTLKFIIDVVPMLASALLAASKITLGLAPRFEVLPKTMRLKGLRPNQIVS